MKNIKPHQIVVPVLLLTLLSTLFSPTVYAYERHKRHHHYSKYRKVISLPRYTRPILFRGAKYYYDRGCFYKKHNGFYISISAPIGAIVASIPINHERVVIRGKTYYYHDDICYIKRPGGYMVVEDPFDRLTDIAEDIPIERQKVLVSPSSSDKIYTVNVPNKNGSYTPVILVKSGEGYLGPQGEYYPDFPKVEQLKEMYGKI